MPVLHKTVYTSLQVVENNTEIHVLRHLKVRPVLPLQEKEPWVFRQNWSSLHVEESSAHSSTSLKYEMRKKADWYTNQQKKKQCFWWSQCSITWQEIMLFLPMHASSSSSSHPSLQSSQSLLVGPVQVLQEVGHTVEEQFSNWLRYVETVPVHIALWKWLDLDWIYVFMFLF